MGLENLRLIYQASPTSVTITSKSGESHRVREIYVNNPVDPSYMNVTIGTTTVARIPVKINDVLLVAPTTSSMENKSIIALLKQLFGAEFDFEADEDEDITLTFSAAPSSVHIVYEIGKAGIDKSKLGRSGSQIMPLMQMITHSSAISANGNYSLDTPNMPTGFPEIADGYTIPSGRIFSIKALAFASKAATDTYATYLHIFDETFELFSPIEHTGIPVKPGDNYLSTDITQLDLYQIEQYDLIAGHKLTANIDAVYDGTNSLAAESDYLILIGLWKPSR